MKTYNKEYYAKYDPEHPWVSRIYQLMKSKKLRQSEVADKCDMGVGTLSEWLNKKSEPKVKGMKKIAEFFDVSMDYLMGKNECKTKNNEVIHKDTGLSDKAISALQSVQKRIQKGKGVDVENKLAACNFIVETIMTSPLLDDLYDYLLGEFYFQSNNGEGLNGAAFIAKKDNSKHNGPSIVYSDVISEAALVSVQSELVRMKDEITKVRKARDKIEYGKWQMENKDQIEKDLGNSVAESNKGDDSN